MPVELSILVDEFLDEIDRSHRAALLSETTRESPTTPTRSFNRIRQVAPSFNTLFLGPMPRESALPHTASRGRFKAAFHDTDILADSPDTPIHYREDPREDPREDVGVSGEDVGVGVVECGLLATLHSSPCTVSSTDTQRQRPRYTKTSVQE